MCHSVLDSCLWGHNTGMCIVLPVVSHCRISIFQHPPICSILHRTGILPNLTCPDGGHSCQENSQCQVSARCLLAMAAAVCPSQSFPAVIPCLPALQDGSSLLSRAWGSKAQFSTAHGSLGCAIWKPWVSAGIHCFTSQFSAFVQRLQRSKTNPVCWCSTYQGPVFKLLLKQTEKSPPIISRGSIFTID